jgi:hypothetical protein
MKVNPRSGGSFPRPAVPLRPVGNILNRSASNNRQQAQQIKRQAVNQAANQVMNRPRPAVRPASPPPKIMPKRPVTLPKPGVTVTPGSITKPQTPMVKRVVKPVTPPAAPPGGVLKGLQKRPVTAPPPVSKPGVGPMGAAVGASLLGSLLLNTASADPQIANDVSVLNSSLSDLQGRSSFEQVQADITELDSALSHALNLLESARDKGYVYQKDLEDIAYKTADRWQPIREQVLANIQAQANIINSQIMPLNSQIQRLNANLGNASASRPLLSNTQTEVNSIISNLYQVESSLKNSYADIWTQIRQLTASLTPVHWALSQLAEAKFKLGEGEDIVIAVKARWDREGDDDPEGILCLSNKRLIFERKEKVATKKILFITVSQELVQEVQIDQKLSEITNVKAINKGLFGHHDFIEVQFKDPKLGAVPFHLDGQGSQEWANWIERARSGEIENDRSTGSGLSIADLTGPLTTADIITVQNEINQLQDLMTLKSIREELGEIENDVRSLERKLANLRSRGYLIEKSLEADVSILALQWDRVKAASEVALQSQNQLLSTQMQTIQGQAAHLVGMSGNLATARPLFMQIKSAIASAEAQADAAAAAVMACYDDYAEEIETLNAHLEWVGWMLDAIETASFQLLATESGVAATEAIWERPGMEPENGILFLTDQRILWEDRVETFEVKLDLPLQLVSDVQKDVVDETGDEFLSATLGAGAPYPTVRFDLALPVADAWLKMIGRARSGGYAQDRAVEIDPAELERIRNAPRQCPNCGAALTAPILRGQVDIACEYCGAVTPI